jgi:hypothetical protein
VIASRVRPALVVAVLGGCKTAEDDDGDDGADDDGPSCETPQCEQSADCSPAACVWQDPGATDCAPQAGGEGGTCPCVKVCEQCLPLAGLGCVDDEGCCEGICLIDDAVPGEAVCTPECSSDEECDGACVARRCTE